MVPVIRKTTVELLAKLLRPLADRGVLSIPEEREIIAQLKYLAEHGTVIPEVLPKLIDQQTAASMLGISLASFKKMEHDGVMPLPRKKIGTAVRYRNTDVVRLILGDAFSPEEDK